MRLSFIEVSATMTVMSIKLSSMQWAWTSWAGLLGPSVGPQFGITGGSGSAAAVRAEEGDDWDANAANQCPVSPSKPIGSASTVQCIRRVVHMEALSSHSPVDLRKVMDGSIIAHLAFRKGILVL